MWDSLVGFVSFVLHELPSFGLWLTIGLVVGATGAALFTWFCARHFYPRPTLDALEAGHLPAPRWLRISLPLFRWCWWVTWCSALPVCVICIGLIWGSGQAAHRAVLHGGLGTRVGQQAALPFIVSMWKEHAGEVDPDKPLPLDDISQVLLKACETAPPAQKHSAAREGLSWFADVVLRKMLGWWLGCPLEHRVFYVKAVIQELRAHPPADRPHGQASLRDVSACGCRCFVEPQMAGWTRAWILGHAFPFVLVILGILLLPRLMLSLLLYGLRRAMAGPAVPTEPE